MIKRIALIGPESTGKSTLCKKLADYYHTRWVPEYGRIFMENRKGSYTLSDIEHIANMQQMLERAASAWADNFLFSDTELIYLKIWCDDVFKTAPDWMEEQISNRPHDLYLLTKPDIPFVPDPVRVNEHRRDYFFELYQQELDRRKLLYEIISGPEAGRLEMAVKHTEFHFGKSVHR